MSDERRWADAATVHEIAARLDPKRPCQFCGVTLHDHPGVLTVITNERDPDRPSVFGDKICAIRWERREPWQPSFRPVTTREWVVGTATSGGGSVHVGRGHIDG